MIYYYKNAAPLRPLFTLRGSSFSQPEPSWGSFRTGQSCNLEVHERTARDSWLHPFPKHIQQHLILARSLRQTAEGRGLPNTHCLIQLVFVFVSSRSGVAELDSIFFSELKVVDRRIGYIKEDDAHSGIH